MISALISKRLMAIVSSALKSTFFSVSLAIGITNAFADSLLDNNLLKNSDAGITEISSAQASIQKQVEESWSLHTQLTYIEQRKNDFYAPYSSLTSPLGNTSLLSRSEGDNNRSFSLSTTAFIGTRLWRGAEAYYNPEMFEGLPFTGSLVGLGGLQNGELQKGSYIPAVTYHARAFIRQTIGLGGGEEYVEASTVNQLAGYVDKNRLVLSWGKVASLDYFDNNNYSHDPRIQFMNFSIFSMAAYGYSADSRGFTYGAVAEWYQDEWITKAARLAAPTSPNQLQIDYTLTKDYVDQIELTHLHTIFGQPGAIRGIGFLQHAYMSTFQDAIRYSQDYGGVPSIYKTRKMNTMFGYGVGAEQAINSSLGIFTRWSWNNDQTETNTLDVGRSFTFGSSLKGSRWGRAEDTVGVAWAINAISQSEIDYLQLGGQTMFIGDGKIQYRPEQIVETYYSLNLSKYLFISADFQKIVNPAYNASRGPVNVLSLRLHFEL